MKKVKLLVTACLLVSAPAMAEDLAPYNCDISPSCEVAPGVYGAMNSPVTSKFNLSLGGYVKLDYVHNTNAVGPVSPAGGLPIGSKEESLFTAKQTRIWLKVAGPTFLGAKTNSVIEMDFQGAGSANEFGAMRMRHAYGTLDWANTQLLFGQTADIFGPTIADTIDSRQGGATGAANNPRVPQIRLTKKLNINDGNSFNIVVGVQNPVQDAAVTGDGSMSKSVSYGDLPNAAGQIMYSSKALGVSPGYMGYAMKPLQLGLFGLAGSQKFTNNKAVDVYGYGIYGFVPVLKSKDGKNRAMTLSLETQAYIAAGMDVQLATAAATVNAAPNMTGAKGFGLYGQLKFYPTQDVAITGGYMRRQAMDYADYKNVNDFLAPKPTSFEKYNDMAYANLTYDLNAAVRVATEYSLQVTKYSTATSSYAQNNCFRLAAYYFF